MIAYKDYYGFDLLNISEVKNAKSKAQLADIIESHRRHIENMLCDAHSHLNSLKKETGLNMLP